MFRSPSHRTPHSPARTTIVAATLLILGLLAPSPTHAQARRPRRESNANRQARVARAIEETYDHRWEVGGGGGYLRFRPGQSLQKNSEIAFWMNGTYFLNPRFGITGEVRGGYGNAKVGNTIYNIPNPKISEYPFLVGATYRFRMREKSSIGAFLLGGAAIGKFDGDSKGIPAANLGMWPSTNARPAVSTGINLDLNLYPNLAARLAPSYTATTFGSTLQNNFGFEMGLVYRFGHQ